MSFDPSKVNLNSLQNNNEFDFSNYAQNTVTARTDVSPNNAELILIIFAAILLISLSIYLAKKTKIVHKIKTNFKLISAYLSGWGIWCFGVFSYEQLFYEGLEYKYWFTLPPLLAILIIAWCKCFVISKNSIN